MENKKSYQELLKEYTMTQLKKEQCMMELQIDLFLNKMILDWQIECKRKQIDAALDANDKVAFYKLTNELELLMTK